MYPTPKNELNFTEIEEKIRSLWQADNTFQRSIDETNDGNFIFYDGPPFANGLPHYGHLLTSFIKDVFARYKTMQGLKTPRRFGWDCHGLPAEMEAEKTLGISGRKAVEDFGINNFNDKCRNDVMKYSKQWQDYITKAGRWVDFNDDYRTMDTSYMESVIWAFKELYSKGLLYEKYRVMPYSWKVQTPLSNFETKMDNSYRQKESKSLYVKFNLNNGKKALVWTTTGWTLPSNLGLAVGKNIDYISINTGFEEFVFAKAAHSRLQKDFVKNGVSSATTTEDINKCHQIRDKVFVEGQSVDKSMETDGLDNSCMHYILRIDDTPVGTSRVRTSTDGLKIERVAILQDHQGKGYGSAIIKKILADLPNSKLYLHSQADKTDFYKKLGFVQQGDTFTEANIEHVKMFYTPQTNDTLSFTDFTHNNTHEMELAKTLRHQVFTQEKCLDESFAYDQTDETYKHTNIYLNNQIIATIRVLIENEDATISRLAISKEFRGLGYAKQIIWRTLSLIIKTNGIKNIWASPLIYPDDHKSRHETLEKFYQIFGFEFTQKTFEEANLQYRKMKLDAQTATAKLLESSSFKGQDLLELSYTPLFPYFRKTPNSFRVVHGDFVSIEDGTGIVHLSPGFGEDDQLVCEQNNIGMLCPVDEAGCYENSIYHIAANTPAMLASHNLIFKRPTANDKQLVETFISQYAEDMTFDSPYCGTSIDFYLEHFKDFGIAPMMVFEKSSKPQQTQPQEGQYKTLNDYPKMSDIQPHQIGKFIGIAGLMVHDDPKGVANGNVELIFFLEPESQNKGYGREIFTFFANITRHSMGLTRLISVVHLNNQKSYDILTKFGFKHAKNIVDPKTNKEIKLMECDLKHIPRMNLFFERIEILRLRKRCVLEEQTNDKGHTNYDGVNEDIIKYLKLRNQWLKTEQYLHNYPHCWRTDTPLIYKAVSSWYVKVTQFKDRMVNLNSGKMKVPYFDDIYVRPWQDSDLIYLQELSKDSDLSKFYPNIQTQTQCADYLNILKQHWNNFNFTHLPVFNKKNDEFLGISGLMFVDPKDQNFEHGNIELSYILKKAAWGTGIATTLVKGFTSWAFDNLPINTLWILANSKNKATIDVAKKCDADYTKSLTNPRTKEEVDVYEITKPHDYQPQNTGINWIPDHIRDGQFGKWLEGARDWSISRNRFWGAPVPIWKSNNPDNNEIYVFGSIQELQDFFGPEYTANHSDYEIYSGLNINILKNRLKAAGVALTNISVVAEKTQFKEQLILISGVNNNTKAQFDEITSSMTLVSSRPSHLIITDLHRPFIDNLTKPDPHNPTYTISRVSDVLDCWFESGSMPFASVHYPFENKEKFASNYPADFIVEYAAQTRGWFYTMMVLSTALFDNIPFKNCICHGVILDTNGQKLSKRLRNYPDPHDMFAKHGSDSMRWFMMSSPVMMGGDLLIDKDGEGFKDVVRLLIKPIYNAYNFFSLYANADNIKASENYTSTNSMDRYILQKLKHFANTFKTSLDTYNTIDATKATEEFIEALNNWYIRLNKERFWKSDKDQDKQSAYDTLYTVLINFCKITAPMLPFTAETIYNDLMTV